MKLPWVTLERWLVPLIALHTVGVGAMLMVAPTWSCTVFGGWGELGPLFFPRQSGVFHFVLAFAYLLEFHRYRGVSIMVFAKSVAVIFLLGATFLDGAPWVVPFSAVTDGLMGLTIYLVHRATHS